MKKPEKSTLENTSSISSAETAASKPWLETARLGQKIVQELGLEHTNKLLNRWMAHRVAEMMERAENAPSEAERDAARRECTDLILRLWEKRMDWPEGGPFAYVLPVLRRLIGEGPTPYKWGWNQLDFDGSWANFLPQLNELHHRENFVCLIASFADIPEEIGERARQWIEEVGQELSDEERELYGILLEWSEMVYSDKCPLDTKQIPHFGSLPADERSKHIQAALQRIADDKAKLLQQAKSQNEPLQVLEPDKMHGNIDPQEESQVEHFDRLLNQIYIVMKNDIVEEEGEDEGEDEDFDGYIDIEDDPANSE